MSDDPVHLDESFEAMTLERKLAIQQPLGYIVTIKQRQTKLLGYNSDCPQCSLATMAHRGVLPRYYNVCACVCPWIYNVVIRNNTEATVYITDRHSLFGAY